MHYSSGSEGSWENHFPPDVVQFSSPVYYCSEDNQEGELYVDVVRLGAAAGKASVRYCTHDGSAVAGTKYSSVEGLLQFAPGETRKRIPVPILENDSFDTSLEFEMHLNMPVNTQLGLYLSKCRIIITDMDTFPTNTFWKDLHACRLAAIPRWSLMWEYIKMNFRAPKLRRAFFWNVVGDQLMNLRFAWTVLLFNHLVDNVLNAPEAPKDASVRVYVVFGLLLVPHFCMVLNDCAKAERRIRGLAINQLQANLMRKFLNYDEASRHTVSTSDLVMAITRDVPELVDDAFLSLMSFCTNVGRLLMLIGLQVYQSSGAHVTSTVVEFFCFPLVLFAFLCLRHRRTESLRKSVFCAQTEIVGFVQQTTDCYRLISDYMQRPSVVSSFQDRINRYNTAAKDIMLVEQVNSRFAPFLTELVVGIVMLVTYEQVITGALPLGQFLSGLAVCESIGKAYEAIHMALLQMQRATAPLLNIVFYMNLPVDGQERLTMSHIQLAEAAELEKTEQTSALNSCGTSSDGPGVYVQDRLPIRGEGLNFLYPDYTGGGHHILKGANFVIDQGSLVAVTGGRASGKATLLKLLSGVLLPSDVPENGPPPLFVPPHLRVLHVSQQVQFMADLDVYENICFGPSDGADESLTRVLQICRRLGVSQAVLDLVENRPNAEYDTEETQPSLKLKKLDTKHTGTAISVAERRSQDMRAHWSSVLSYTDRCLIHIARALVMNPEVLVVHQPLAHFDDDHQKLVMGLLREFVDERGIEQPHEGRVARRPRTCIFSAASAECSESVDMVLHVTDKKVEKIDMEALGTLRRMARALFKALDLNSDGRVSLEEFLDVTMKTPWICQLLGVSEEKLQNKDDVKATLVMVFGLLDVSGSGDIDIQELVQFLRRRLDHDLVRMLALMEQQNLFDEPPEPGPERRVSEKRHRRSASRWADQLQVAQEEVVLRMPRQEPRIPRSFEGSSW